MLYKQQLRASQNEAPPNTEKEAPRNKHNILFKNLVDRQQAAFNCCHVMETTHTGISATIKNKLGGRVVPSLHFGCSCVTLAKQMMVFTYMCSS
jgi:hypothetical protein